MQEQAKRLSKSHLRLFVAVLIQNSSVFEHFNSLLKAEQFETEFYQVVFGVVQKFHNENHELPTRIELLSDIDALFEKDSELLSDEDYSELMAFLEYAFDPESFGDTPPSSKKMEEFAYRAGKRLLMERLGLDTALKLHQGISIEELSSFFHNAAEQAEMLSKKEYSDAPSLTFSHDWDKRDPEFIYTTGLEFFDKYMAGGAKKGEIYGLMAPYGTCKTTIAVMLWCKAAKQCWTEANSPEFKEKSGRKGLSVLVTYEAPLAHEIRHRALMYAAEIHRESLDKMGFDGLDALNNDPDNPLPYETIRFRKHIEDGLFKPERKRVEDVIPYLNEHTVCLDFTGADPDWPLAGNGGIGEIVSRLNIEIRNRGGEEKCYIKNVIIDYWGLMLDRDNTIMKSKVKEDDHKVYQKQISEANKNISQRYKCHTWVMHQLSGAANAILSPTRQVHHTDAKGSKSFAENLTFSFVIGNLNLDQLGQIHCTKQRRSKKIPPSIIKVEGEFNTVYAPDNYHVDGRGQIVDTATAKTVGIQDGVISEDPDHMLLGLENEVNSIEND